jgi:hypothetical protein
VPAGEATGEEWRLRDEAWRGEDGGSKPKVKNRGVGVGVGVGLLVLLLMVMVAVVAGCSSRMVPGELSGLDADAAPAAPVALCRQEGLRGEKRSFHWCRSEKFAMEARALNAERDVGDDDEATAAAAAAAAPTPTREACRRKGLSG